MRQTIKQLALLPAAVLVIALAVQMPSFANAQGSCNVAGTGTAFGPNTETFSSTNSSNGVVITYTVETECLDKAAGIGDNVTATFNINATCDDTSSPGACATLSDFGTIGTYEPADKLCNKADSWCTVGTVTANEAASIPNDGTEVQILSGSAVVNTLPSHGNTVAHLGEVSITVPNGFGQVNSPDFSIAFQAPRS